MFVQNRVQSSKATRVSSTQPIRNVYFRKAGRRFKNDRCNLQSSHRGDEGGGGYSPKGMLFIVTNKCYGIENAAIVSHVRKYAPVVCSFWQWAVNRGMKNVRQSPSWCRPSLECHKLFAPLFIQKAKGTAKDTAF